MGLFRRSIKETIIHEKENEKRDLLKRPITEVYLYLAYFDDSI